MGPFPHDAAPATISDRNPARTDVFEFVEFAHLDVGGLAELFQYTGFVATPGRSIG
jgi:4-hydroxyphenylpyruvate dioxygenase